MKIFARQTTRRGWTTNEEGMITHPFFIPTRVAIRGDTQLLALST